MKYQFAPMEGITYTKYRCLHNRMFGSVDEYFSPFIAPDSKGSFKAGSLKNVFPENNPGIVLIPQILANNSSAFLSVARELHAMGYTQVNLNAGCPSGTVVSKHKGAGMLADLDSLDRFLAEVFSSSPVKVSVKTRLGLTSTAEFEDILPIYNRYPIHELIIHVRDRAGQYRSAPDYAAFQRATESTGLPLVFNGNAFRAADCEQLKNNYPTITGIMIGRGAIANPAIFRELKTGIKLEKEELHEFHDRLIAEYIADGLHDRYAVMRMKEVWFYMRHMFLNCDREIKIMNKSVSYSDYIAAVEQVFRQGDFSCDAGFQFP